MEEEKLIERLEKTELPARIPTHLKNELRRALLHSGYFEKRHAWWQALKYVLSGAVSAAATAVIIFYLITPRSFSSAEELLRHVESSYVRLAAEGPVHYMHSLFKTLNGPAPMEEEEWSYDHYNQFSIVTRDAVSGAILGHTIKVNGQMYSRRRENRELKFNIEEKVLPNDGSAGRIRKINNEMRVVALPLVENPKLIQIFVFHDSRTPETFSRQTPQEIIRQIKSDLQMQYKGKETDAKGRTFEVLEKTEEQNVFLFQSEAGHPLDDIVPSLIKRIENNEIVNSEKVDVQELIKIDSQTGKINQVMHSVHKNGKEIERFELTFLDEKYLNYDPLIFDPVQQGLTPIPMRQK